MVNVDQNKQLGAAIESVFSNEPVAVGTAVSMAVTGTLATLAQLGYVGGESMTVIMGAMTLWLPVIGLIVRSQYTPFARRL